MQAFLRVTVVIAGCMVGLCSLMLWMGMRTNSPMLTYRSGLDVFYAHDAYSHIRFRVFDETRFGYTPHWSPDARALAYLYSPEMDRQMNLYVKRRGAPGETMLSEDVSIGSRPMWSADGQSILYVGRGQPVDIESGGDVFNEFFSVNPVTGVATQLTNNRVSKTCGVWSPDEQQIAYRSLRAGVRRIYVMNLETGAEVVLTDRNMQANCPSWSPDGEHLVFDALPDDTISVIYVINLESQTYEPLMSMRHSNAFPVWSPDGEWIAYQSSRNGNWDIYATHFETRREIRITSSPIDETFPIWLPFSGG